jgi:hypothetical protein
MWLRVRNGPYRTEMNFLVGKSGIVGDQDIVRCKELLSNFPTQMRVARKYVYVTY